MLKFNINNSFVNNNIVNKGNYIKPIILQSSNAFGVIKSTIHPFHLVDPSPGPLLQRFLL